MPTSHINRIFRLGIESVLHQDQINYSIRKSTIFQRIIHTKYVNGAEKTRIFTPIQVVHK